MVAYCSGHHLFVVDRLRPQFFAVSSFSDDVYGSFHPAFRPGGFLFASLGVGIVPDLRFHMAIISYWDLFLAEGSSIYPVNIFMRYHPGWACFPVRPDFSLLTSGDVDYWVSGIADLALIIFDTSSCLSPRLYDLLRLKLSSLAC